MDRREEFEEEVTLLKLREFTVLMKIWWIVWNVKERISKIGLKIFIGFGSVEVIILGFNLMVWVLKNLKFLWMWKGNGWEVVLMREYFLILKM